MMDLLTLAAGAGNASGSPVQAEPITGSSPAVTAASAQTPVAFSDALLNVVNTLMAGQGENAPAVSVSAEGIRQKASEEAKDATVEDSSLLRVDAQQQLLDALLMPRPQSVSIENMRTGEAATTHSLLQQTPDALSGYAPALNGATGLPQAVSGAETALPVTPAMGRQLQVAPQLMTAMTAMTAVTPELAVQPAGTQSSSVVTVSNDAHTSQGAPLKLDTEDSRWTQQLQRVLGERLQVQVKNQIQHATIRLDPPEMGKIDISLQIDNGRMQVQINASHAEVYRALQQTSNDLRQSLTEQNFVQVNVQVSSQSGGQQQEKGSPFAEQQAAIQSAPEIATGATVADETRRKDDSVLLTV